MNSGSPNLPTCLPPLRSTFADDPDMRELIDLFISDLSERIDLIAKSAERAEYDRLRTVTHQLKGAAAGYGFAPIGEAARILEMTLRIEQPPFDDEAIQQQTEELLNICRRALQPAA